MKKILNALPFAAIVAGIGLWGLRSGTWSGAGTHDTTAGSPNSSDAVAGGKGARISVPERQVELASHEVPFNSQSSPPAEPAIESDEDRGRRQVIGEWEDDYRGHRRLNVRADGTATMHVEPSGMGRKLFADKLRFDIEWSLAEGRVVMITTGGEPASKTKLILNLYGTRAEYRLLSLDDRQMVLLDADGKTKYEWRRIADDDGKQ